MDRRRFLLTSMAGALAAPHGAEAQQTGRRVPRAGFLLAGDPSSPIVVRVVEGFRRGLREHGEYVEGQNIAIEFRSGDLNGVPWYAKAFTAILVAYALSPIDLIPDFIPVLGYLDELVLLPIGILLAVRMIPAELFDAQQ